MLDFIKRFCIALALAVFIGILFIGANTSFAADQTPDDDLYESLIWPTVGDVTDTYGTRGGKHYGIDIAAPEGTPVVSVADGVINRSYYSDTYGHVVFIEHDNGLETVYAHLHKRKVEDGQVVKAGEKIGSVGNTGRSSGNHLHFEVHVGNWNVAKSKSIDPILVLSTEPEAMYAAVGGVPEGLDIDEEMKDVVYAMSHHIIENINQSNNVEEQINEEKTEVVRTSVSVKTGDNLWNIANDYQVSVDEIVEWNELESEIIHPGEELVIYPEKRELYVVKDGDTLSSISLDYDVSVTEIMTMNGLNSDVIISGQTLKLN